MSYKNRIRFITNKKGLDYIYDFLNYYGDDVCKDILNPNSCKIYGDIAYLYWDNTPYFRLISSIIIATMKPSILYRVCMIDNVNNSFSAGSNKIFDNSSIPEFKITHSIDSNKIIKQLNQYEIQCKNKIDGGAYGL